MGNSDTPTDDYLDLAALEDVPMDGQLALTANGRKVLLCRIPDGVYAMADNCPHAHQTLAGGPIRGTVIRCPRHGACFDLTTGKSLTPISRQPLTMFPVVVRDGRVLVKVPAPITGFMPDFSGRP